MAIEVRTSQSARTTKPASSPGRSPVVGLRCRACRRPEPIGLSYVCPACFGPLEVEYDYAIAGRTLTRAAIAARAPGIWRYAELLPIDAPPARGLPVGSTPLISADRLAPTLGLDRLWIKDDTRNPSLSFKDRAVAVAAARAVEFGVPALACASTGNLAGATAAAAAVLGLPAYVFIPADLEPAKVEHALAYGATVVPIEGTYDDVNRLCLEIAEALGWRSPDVVVAPVASGAMFTRVARGFEELVELGLIERRPIRYVGGQAAGCAPVATAWAAGTDVIEPVRVPDTIVRSLAIGNPADGRYVVELADESGGSVEAIEDVTTAATIRDVARLEGIYPETAGGVTLAAAAAAARRGVIRPGDEVVALVTGNGLKTPDARTLGLVDGVARPGQPGLAPAIRPSLSAFERWLGGGVA